MVATLTLSACTLGGKSDDPLDAIARETRTSRTASISLTLISADQFNERRKRELRGRCKNPAPADLAVCSLFSENPRD